MTYTEVIDTINDKFDSLGINEVIYINNEDTLNTTREFNDCELVIRRLLNDVYIFTITKSSTSGSLEKDTIDMPKLTLPQFYFINQLMKIKNNDIKYVFHFSDECPILKNFIFDFYNLMVNNNIELNNIFIGGSDFYGKYFINNMNTKYGTPLFSYILKWDLVNHTGIDSISISDSMFLNKSIKKYKTTALFGRIDEVRVNFIYNLYNIEYFNKDNLYSCFSNQENDGFSHKNYKYADYILSKKNLYRNLIETILKKTKVGYSHESEKQLTPSLMRFVPENNDSYLWITSESIPTVHDVMFITEKTLKSFLWYKPLIVYSVPNTIKLLKLIGFIDVFELMGFDSSYDTESNDDKRLDMIVSQIDLFIKKSKEEIHELYHKKNVQDALIHNNKLFKKLIGDTVNLHNRDGETATNKTITVFEESLKQNILSQKTNTELPNLIDKFDLDFKLFFK